MQRIPSNTDKNIWIHEYDGHSPLTLPFEGDFVCAIWNESDTILSNDITKWLLDNHCKYALCGGNFCEEQELEIDRLHVQKTQENPEWPHIMTSTHEGESIEEVTDFALNCTDFDDYEFSNYVILYVGEATS